MAWVTSFFKSRWRFEDDPIDYVDQGESSPFKPKRFWHLRWRADVVNWRSVSGMGETKESALADAKQKFASWEASGEKMWRPGTGPGIVFASEQAIDRYPELRDDFIHKVLRLEWAFISDESSLWDFHENETNDEYFTRIYEVYRVDVSDREGANIAAILEKIAPHASTH
jgi:hypothetical protein